MRRDAIMKKFILGLLIGMALMCAGSAFADDIQSFIGKTIQGQFPVTVDGKSLDMPAIVIDGTSFLPVRSFGESVGYNVYFDPQGAIKLEKQVAAANAQTIQNFSDRQAAYDKVKAERDAKEKALQDQIKAEQDAAAAEKAAIQKRQDEDIRKAQEAMQKEQQAPTQAQ
jgi:hypothetical protein